MTTAHDRAHTLPPTLNEFHFDGAFLSLATNIGLLVGANLWSFGCDIWGRKSVTPYALLLLRCFHPSYSITTVLMFLKHEYCR